MGPEVLEKPVRKCSASAQPHCLPRVLRGEVRAARQLGGLPACATRWGRGVRGPAWARSTEQHMGHLLSPALASLSPSLSLALELANAVMGAEQSHN